MKAALNRVVKYFCKDPSRIQSILREIGASYFGSEDQADYIYHIFNQETGNDSKRIKIRVVNGSRYLIYIYSRKKQEVSVEYDYFEFSDDQVLALLNSLYKVSIIVKKQRIIWKKNNFIFHLDSVSGIGDIFEIESKDLTNTSGEIEMYISLFSDYLLEQIHVSNEDLVQGDPNE